MSETPLLRIEDLSVGFQVAGGAIIPAVKNLNLDLMPGETLAIVGESGSGKSTTAHAIINLLPGTGRITGGRIMLDGQDLTQASEAELEKIRGTAIGFVPQDPMSNLNPVWSVGFQVEETVRANGLASTKQDVRKKAIEVLAQAGLTDAGSRMKQYPHQFSGGMRQRVLIGIGLAANPRILIADEPTSALDVTVQRAILDHLQERTREQGTAVILITHDLGLAAERAEQLVVMYRGQVVESGPSLEILKNPQHPYTKRLVQAAPSLSSRRLVSARASVSATGKAAIAQADASTGTATAIEVNSLTKVYNIRSGNFTSTPLTAVDNVSFSIERGSTTALVGESGSGKSTVARMLLGLEKPTAGSILIDGQEVDHLGKSGMKALRRRMQPVFQDPYGSLNPLRSITATIAEPLLVHGVGNRAERQARVFELLDQVSLPRSIAGRYPSELSGGQRQRVAIARALALKPDIVILDEAVSALDVLVQAQILELLNDLQSEYGLTYLFITHDLAVVRLIADHVCVMNQGKIVEAATTKEVFEHPREDYTRKLLDAIPGATVKFGA